MVKKIYFLALMAMACGQDNDPKTSPTSDEPKQYGTPYANVPSVQNIVLYEVNTRGFSTGGNFQGVIERLDSIQKLGVNTIWLMPINPVGQVKSAGGLGSPYSVRNYLQVNAEFGDLAKLRELVQKAHDRNMAVIIDWVANHTSWDNPWIANKAWYSQDANGNIIIPPGTNWQDVAELNYDNQDMRKAMIKAMKYWVLEANVDGYRCDAVDFVPSDFWKQAIDSLKNIKGRSLIFLAEGGQASNFTAGFQMNYAWDFYTNIKEVYQNSKAATSIFTTHEAEMSAIPAGGKKLRYTSNHDICAWEGSAVQTFGSTSAALSASVITVFTSAVPLIYSGQEVGRPTELSFFVHDPIDWNINITMEKAYRRLFTLYNSTNVFSQGSLAYFANNDIAVFKRTLDTEQYLVLVNVRSSQKTYTLDTSLKGTWTNALSGEGVSLDTSVSLNGYQYLILKK